MSSSPPPETAERSARPRRPATLRVQLLLVLVGIVAVLCTTIGVVSTFAVYRFQLNQKDEQLDGAFRRALGPEHGGQPGPGFRPVPGQLVAENDDGQLTGSIRGGFATDDKQLSDAALAVLAEVPGDGRSHTVDVPGAGEYRVRRGTGVDGDQLILGTPLDEINETLERLILLEVVVGLGAVLLAVAGGTVLIQLTLRPLHRVAATATRVTRLPLARGEVSLAERVAEADADPRTEVGQVGAALNRMLGHVGDALAARHASETRLRRFIADASHELRTPLAAIRGYTELTRRGRRTEQELTYAVERVDAAAQRMTMLVEDLLLLARLDSGRPLRTDPVDLSAVVVEAVSDAHVAGPTHRWMLDLPEDSVTVVGDRDRLHQVVGNLLANARVHTPPATTVTVALGVQGPHAVLRVVDTGPGIPPELREHVFERFARGDSSRSRKAGSSGLGLSIVASVVGAHRGAVEVDSVPGRTAFTVRLPLVAG